VPTLAQELEGVFRLAEKAGANPATLRRVSREVVAALLELEELRRLLPMRVRDRRARLAQVRVILDSMRESTLAEKAAAVQARCEVGRSAAYEYLASASSRTEEA
jgi:hypothetical protein